jgi:hypothetical protein
MHAHKQLGASGEGARNLRRPSNLRAELVLITPPTTTVTAPDAASEDERAARAAQAPRAEPV